MTFHHLGFALFVTCAVSFSFQQSALAQTLTKESHASQTPSIDSDMWNGFNLNKDFPDIESSKTDALWDWQTTQPGQNELQIFTQDQTSTNNIDRLQTTSLPSGFTGAPNELNEIKKRFSSYKPQTTHIKRGKIYLRKDLQKPEEWKPTLQADPNRP